MSKIYEALEQAQRARAGSDKLVTVPHASQIFTGQAQISLEEEMLCLYKNIDALLSNVDKRIIQFIGSRHGEGTSTIAREFAKIAASMIGKSVLLLDADRTKPSHHKFFNFETDHGWQESIIDKELDGEVFQRIDESLLCVGRSSNSASCTPEMFDSPKFQCFKERIAERFDLVVIDSPPLNSSPDALAIAPKMTGIILVVEAESTGWRVIQGTINKIKQVGGNILGVALNKRRYYIPEFIYKRL